MEAFDHVLNWKLKRGSHPFPGPDGGTCINEAALVAAGFEYRPINFVSQMPRCFSRPICRLAMQLNDHAEDNERQLLLPFVTRLACADTPEVERRRAAYIRAHLFAGIAFVGITPKEGIKILEGALAIGRQARPLGPDIAKTRMEAAKGKANTVAPRVERSALSKLKAWFAAGKVVEPAD